MTKKLRIVLLAAVVLLAVPAATARAVSRMPVGFYDDPSFRWSPHDQQQPGGGAGRERLDHPRARQLVARSRRRGRRTR